MTTPVLLVSLVALALLVWALGLLEGRARTDEELRCPADDKGQKLLFERRLDLLWDLGRPVDVVACSAFDPTTDVRCSKSCLTGRT